MRKPQSKQRSNVCALCVMSMSRFWGAAGEAATRLDTDELEKKRQVVEDRLLYAIDAANANRIYRNAVLQMWKLAASNLVEGARPSRLILYRFLFMDRWLAGVSCSKSHKRFSLRLDDLRDQHLMLTHGEVLNGYSDVVKDTADLLVRLQSSRRRVISGVATVCAISGISTVALVTWLF